MKVSWIIHCLTLASPYYQTLNSLHFSIIYSANTIEPLFYAKHQSYDGSTRNTRSILHINIILAMVMDLSFDNYCEEFLRVIIS